MSEAPDRIWAWAWCFQTAEHGGWSEWGGYARHTNIHALDDRERATGAEYVRADLVTPPQITDAMVKTASRYGNRNPVKMYNERNALEKAIRAHDPEATEAAWEKVVQWLDLSFAALGVKR